MRSSLIKMIFVAGVTMGCSVTRPSQINLKYIGDNPGLSVDNISRYISKSLSMDVKVSDVVIHNSDLSRMAQVYSGDIEINISNSADIICPSLGTRRLTYEQNRFGIDIVALKSNVTDSQLAKVRDKIENIVKSFNGKFYDKNPSC